MADLHLNKPLYDSDDKNNNGKPGDSGGGGEGDKEFTPPTPRKPKASLLGRGAAIFLDVMLLHLLMGVVVRFLPEIPLALGKAAPWVGLAIGYCYFGFGFSSATLGRTFGKLITRVQVAEITGPDLTMKQAFIRAALLLSPLPIKLILSSVAEHYANTDPTSIFTTLEVFGTMLVVGWALGNLGFAAFDPYGRTLYDRIAGSIVINAELEPGPVAEYLADARAANRFPPAKKSITSLGLGLTMCLAFGAASSVAVMRQLRDLSDMDKARIDALIVPGYGRAWSPPSSNDSTTTDTIPVSFQVRRRGHFSVDAIKADSVAKDALDRLIDNFSGPASYDELKEYILQSNRDKMSHGEKLTSTPQTVRFDLSFVEYADLFFAHQAHPVYTVSRDVDLPTTLTEALDNPTTVTKE